jgi:uncharacterized protein
MQTSEPAAALSTFTNQDAWAGAAYLVIWVVASSAISLIPVDLDDYFGVIFLVMQVSLLLPVGVIALRRKLPWPDLGLRNFERSAIALGCTWLLLVYGIVIVHNLVLLSLKIDTQVGALQKLLGAGNIPWWLSAGGIVVAPIVEELYFRGFLFAAFRSKYTWKIAALISAVLFGLAHGQWVAFIPTALLGYTFAYLYERTRSIWPGIILHCLVNSFGFCAIALIKQFPT